jgi:hypothetical protein
LDQAPLARAGLFCFVLQEEWARMLTRTMMAELVPENGTYNGSARMLFRDPEGSIDGKATIRLSADGHATVRIDVERYSIPAEYHNFLMAFLQGSKTDQGGDARTTFRIGEANRFGSLEITTAEGTFRADRALVGDGEFHPFGGENEWFEAVPYGLELRVVDGDPEEIWCAPLFGELAEFERCANACLLNGQTPYVHFSADGNDCGLVIFGSGGVAPASDRKFAAAVFGVIGNRQANSADEVSALIPWGLFAALSFASGCDTQVPWIELRDHNGELKRRLHLRYGGTNSESGFPTFSRFDSATPNSGIAEFVRLFFSLPEKTRPRDHPDAVSSSARRPRQRDG